MQKPFGQTQCDGGRGRQPVDEVGGRGVEAPVGVGAVVGGVGNRLMAKKIIANAHMAFGNPPARWPSTLHLLPAPRP